MKQILVLLLMSSWLVARGKFEMHAANLDGVPAVLGEAAQAHSSMAVNGPFYADGSTPADVRVQISDAAGQPLADVPVYLTVTGDRNLVIPCSNTDTSGRSQCTVFSTYAENKSFVVHASSVVLNQVVDFDLHAHQRATLVIVSAGDSQRAASGQVITSTSGANESPLALQDSNGVNRVFTSILASMM